MSRKDPWPRLRRALLYKPSRHVYNSKKRLTAEALTRVFQRMKGLAYDPIDARQDMFSVSQVCKSWREVSINHREKIWGSLPIDLDTDSEEFIQELLRWSSSSPLSIYSGIPIDSDDSPRYNRWLLVLEEFHRFESLSFVDDITNYDFQTYLEMAAPLLRSFEAKITEPPIPCFRNILSQELFGGNAPNLRHVNLTGYTLASNSFLGLNLTTLFVNVKACPPSIDEWVEILWSQQNLVSLTIKHALCLENDNPASSLPPVKLPLLQELCIMYCRSIDCGLLLNRLSTPSLCKLELCLASHNDAEREEEETCLHANLKWFVGCSTNKFISSCKLVDVSMGYDTETSGPLKILSFTAFPEESLSDSQDAVFKLSYLTQSTSEDDFDLELSHLFQTLKAIDILAETTAIRLKPLPQSTPFSDPLLELLLMFKPGQLRSIEFYDPTQFAMLTYVRPSRYSQKLLLECENIHVNQSCNDLDLEGNCIEELSEILQYRKDRFGVKTSSIIYY
ncbi:hypothetical protein JR316_0013122 [Psilocybe cubensis]|uniref:F-box domain-containing protein n=2 Tax=Psilocybe cubensis TaxID=181762 RepID=A0A8H8CI89_PSICU|nr:hypothetical protein JR316_0013122 [Psilocybe cubensis]KAH9474658.1 hypothetical protein JR316_0013122 [Psilocybe cubensis]